MFRIRHIHRNRRGRRSRHIRLHLCLRQRPLCLKRHRRLPARPRRRTDNKQNTSGFQPVGALQPMK
jgi:hypothetical protein